MRTCSPQVQAILEAWLHPTNTASSSSSSSSSCRTPLQALTPSLSGWVAPEEEKASREEHSSQFKTSPSLFQLPLDPELWVLPGQTCPVAPGSGGPPQSAAEEDKWLLKKRSQAQVTGPVLTNDSSAHLFTNWLLPCLFTDCLTDHLVVFTDFLLFTCTNCF